MTVRDEGLGCQVSHGCVCAYKLTVLTSIVGKIFWNMLVVSCRGKSPLTNPESTIWKENRDINVVIITGWIAFEEQTLSQKVIN